MSTYIDMEVLSSTSGTYQTYCIAPNFHGIFSWLNPRSQMFYLQKFNFWGRCPFMSWACDALNIKPGFDKDMTPLASRNPTLQTQCYLVLPGLSLRMPSFCIELVGRTTNAWQKSWREQATQHPSRPQNQPDEECMRSTHPRKRQRLVVMHDTTATIRLCQALQQSRNF